MQIHVNQLSFLKAVSSFRGAGGCGSIITASTVTLLWKWGAGLLGDPAKPGWVQKLWVKDSTVKSTQNLYKGQQQSLLPPRAWPLGSASSTIQKKNQRETPVIRVPSWT